MERKIIKVVECIDDETNKYETLKICFDELQADFWLTYYLNHGHDAYLEYNDRK